MKEIKNNNKEEKIIIRDAMDDAMDSVMANSCEYLKEYIAELGLSYDSPFDEENKKSKSIIDVINMQTVYWMTLIRQSLHFLQCCHMRKTCCACYMQKILLLHMKHQSKMG